MNKKITWKESMEIFFYSYWASNSENKKDRIIKLMEEEVLRLANVYDELEETSNE